MLQSHMNYRTGCVSFLSFFKKEKPRRLSPQGKSLRLQPRRYVIAGPAESASAGFLHLFSTRNEVCMQAARGRYDVCRETTTNWIRGDDCPTRRPHRYKPARA